MFKGVLWPFASRFLSRHPNAETNVNVNSLVALVRSETGVEEGLTRDCPEDYMMKFMNELHSSEHLPMATVRLANLLTTHCLQSFSRWSGRPEKSQDQMMSRAVTTVQSPRKQPTSASLSIISASYMEATFEPLLSLQNSAELFQRCC